MSSQRAITTLVIHCSATSSGQRLAKPGHSAAVVIDGWHKARGFARQPGAAPAFNPQLPCIGYHYVIDLSGDVVTGRGEDEVGAHVAGHNANSLGICLVGGAEREARYTAAQWAALAQLVRRLRNKYNAALEDVFTSVDVVGHRDLSPDLNKDGKITSIDWLKTCPGFDVAAWLQRAMQPLSAQVCEVPA
jgi:N-acetylmuramoyl-L-alanine amidase